MLRALAHRALGQPITRFRVAMAMIFIAFALLLLVLAIFNIDRTETPGAIVFTYGRGVTMLPGLASIIMIVSSPLIATARVGWLRLFAILPLAVGLAFSFLAFDTYHGHLDITATELLLPQRAVTIRELARVKWEDIRSITIRDEPGRPADIKRGPEREMLVRLTNTRELTFPMGDLMRAALADIISASNQRNIPVTHE